MKNGVERETSTQIKVLTEITPLLKTNRDADIEATLVGLVLLKKNENEAPIQLNSKREITAQRKH